MTFKILMTPLMKEFWDKLNRAEGKSDVLLRKKIGKALYLISTNPMHPGLHSHEIAELSRECDAKIFESYLENKTPAAGRIFWTYGPNRREITILGVEPHPSDKNNSYKKIKINYWVGNIS